MTGGVGLVVRVSWIEGDVVGGSVKPTRRKVEGNEWRSRWLTTCVGDRRDPIRASDSDSVDVARKRG